ncbi:hypothetical protein ACVIGB_000652 [Bradyrhizobium sp. USDA 4341]
MPKDSITKQKSRSPTILGVGITLSRRVVDKVIAMIPRTPTSRTKIAIVMAVLTALYLTLEIPFGALLLDTVSSADADADAIARLEKLGRLVAGTALALAVLPFLLNSGRVKALPAGLISVAIIAAAFVGQRSLVDGIADRSNGETRSRAVQALTIREAMEPKTAADRALVSLSPLTAFVRPDALREAGGLQDLTLRRARTILGDEATFRSGAYSQATDAARSMFDAYRAADRALTSSRADAHESSAKAWRKWYDWLNSRTYGLAVREGIRSQEDVRAYGRIARQQGVPVPEGWYSLDEATFRAAAEHAYLDGIAKRAKASPFSGVRPGITDFSTFVREAAIQEKLRQVTGPVAVALTGSDASAASFRDTAWKPAILAVQTRIMNETVASPTRYADGGDLAEAGRSAMRSVSVPPIALALSIAGLALHLFKFANYLLLIAFSRRGSPLSVTSVRLAVVAVVLVAATIVLRDRSLPITHTASWEASQTAIAATYGETAAAAATFVIEIQPATYGFSSEMASLPHFSAIASWVRGPHHAANPKLVIADAR